MKTYNVGFVGFGFIGKVHAYGYINLPLFYEPAPVNARITHICTSRPETAEKGKEQIGAEVATTDFREVTENPDVDIVHICSPNDCHRDELLSAMAHGKHIYCDKPLTATMDEADEIHAAMKDYAGIAQMTLQNRFFPASIRAKQLIEEGFLGDLLELRACYLHSGSANPSAPLKWKLSGAKGGGVIADLGTHIMDLVHYLVGDYASLMSLTHIAYPERPSLTDPGTMLPVDAEDCVMLLARIQAGGIAHIEASKIATGTEDELRFEIHGSKGALRFNTMEPHYLDIFDEGADGKPVGGRRGWTRVATGQRYPAPAAGFPSPKNSIGWMRSHMACLANFLQAIREDKPATPGLAQGVYLQHLIDCARRSAGENAWVDVKPSGEFG